MHNYDPQQDAHIELKINAKRTPTASQPELANQSEPEAPQPEPAIISQRQPQPAKASQMKSRVNQSEPAENYSQLKPFSLILEGSGLYFFLRNVFFILKKNKRQLIGRSHVNTFYFSQLTRIVAGL